VYVVLLVPAIPLFAEAEERRFRVGAETWSTRRRIWRGIVFGSVHALIGIPIAVALALSVGGWWFIYRYLKGGLLESTRAHAAYNGVIVLLLLVALASGGVT
jgi:cell division protein FtsX